MDFKTDMEFEPKERLKREGYGFFTRITDARLFRKIGEKAKLKKYFTDRVTSERVTVHLSDIALVISPSKRLTYISLVRPTRLGSTGTSGFKAIGPIPIDLGIEEIITVVDEKFREDVTIGFNEPSFRPNLLAWKAIWHAIKELCPEFSNDLRKIEQLRFDDSFEFQEDSEDERIFHEKDAVGMALAVAGISFSSVFAGLAEGMKENKSLIETLCGNPIEDLFVDHDVHNFPDYLLQHDHLQACEFDQRGKKLTIYNVNRRDGERALGVDLIYHNVTYNAFTFIQYKMLNSEGSAQLPAWRYRPDKQFHEELTRMRAARKVFIPRHPSTPDLFRLSNDPFYFKFCKRQKIKVNSGQLASGAYLNLTHIDSIISQIPSDSAKVFNLGANVNRWLNRTQFSSLIARGWIGTNNVSSTDLQNYITKALDSGRSVLVAVGNCSNHKTDEFEEYD